VIPLPSTVATQWSTSSSSSSSSSSNSREVTIIKIDDDDAKKNALDLFLLLCTFLPIPIKGPLVVVLAYM